MPSDYRLSPSLAARLLGVVLGLVGVLVCTATVVIALAGLPVVALAVVVVVALVVVLVAGFALTRSSYVVRLTEDGYRVRFVRGAGVASAAWRDVDDVVTGEVAGAPCIVLRLRDGRTTTIPVEVLAGRPDDFVRDLREHLQRGHGLRPLG